MKLHPLIVHFPIALLYVAGGLYVGFGIKKDPFFYRAGKWAHGAGLIGMLMAILTGRSEKGGLEVGEEAATILNQHELWGYLGFWVLIMVGLWIYLRDRKLGSPEGAMGEKWGGLAGYVLGIAMMTFAASQGGELVYEWGIGTSLQP